MGPYGGPLVCSAFQQSRSKILRKACCSPIVAKQTAQKLYNELETLLLLERSEEGVLRKLSIIRNHLPGLGNSVDVAAVAILAPRLALLLEKYPDTCEVQAGIVHILKTVCSHERGGDACAEALAGAEALPPLLALYSRQRTINRELYTLLACICTHDKMFAVKARFSGVFAMPLNDLTALATGQAGPVVTASREMTTQPILQVLRAVLANRLNVSLLNRRGLLVTLLNQLKKKPVGTIDIETVLLVESIAAASKSKNSVMQLMDQNVLEVILPILERGGLMTGEKARYLLAVLQILLHVVSFKMGRKAVTRKGACQQLMGMADSVAGQQGLLNGISEVLYRCLPPLKLPVERTSRTYTQLLRENFNKRLPSPPNKDSSESSLVELFDRITSFDENLEDLPYLGNIDRKQVLHKLAKDAVRPPPEGVDQGGWVAEAEFWMLNPANLQLSLEPLNVSPALESASLLNHLKAHYTGELTTKKFPVVYDVTQGPLFEDLSFESRFEGGNLRRVVQRSPREYDLILNADVNSNRHHFWFYFGVKNLTARVVYTFNIINLDRRDTMYTKRGSAGGLSPIFFADGTWTRLSSLPGFSLSCYKNHYRHPLKGHHYYTLSLTFLLPTNSACYISSSFPYSYSLLRTHLCTTPFNTNTVFYKARKMCNSVLGNKCYLLTITDKTNGMANAGQKPVIFLSSRVHPGETNSSHIMNGALQVLLSDHPTAVSVREKFVFYVVPMINPDGVVCGNQRCGMAGVDLNRQYENPCPVQHPTVFHTKALLAYLVANERSPLVCVDIHGHSRAHNVFMFGCEDTPAHRLIPSILHAQLKSFNHGQCTFKTEASKRAALRIAVWRELKVSLSYTMECTVAGCDFRNYKGFHLGVDQLEEIGRELIWAFDKIGTDRGSLDMIAAKMDFDCQNNRTESPSAKVQLSDSSSSDEEQHVIEDDD